MEVSIQPNMPVNVENTPFEAVERKGVGHPDTLCDAIAELASQEYSAAVHEQTGRLPHHYFDKVMLMGGAVRMGFGYGEIVQPYRVQFAGKVTREAGSEKFPVTDIARNAARTVLVDVLHENFDPDKDLVVLDELRDYQGPSKRRPRYQPENVESMPVMDQPGRVSNDVNICTGFAPFSRTERAVLATEGHLNSKAYKERHPYTGMDIKVAGVRMGKEIKLTVNMPFISTEVSSMDEYRELTEHLKAELRSFYQDSGFEDVNLDFNPQDVSGLPYLSVSGSVADTGDVGVVGRGNRANGLITPQRPMSIEAVSGKSPIDNTGKMYGIEANRLSEEIFDQTGLWNNATIVTFRDRPLGDPANVLIGLDGHVSPENEAHIRDIVERRMANVPNMTSEFILRGIVSW
jgi:S-adenosylmethionine synthetase